MIMNILNESVAIPIQPLPEMDLFGAGIVTIIGLIALIIIIRFFLMRKKEE